MRNSLFVLCLLPLLTTCTPDALGGRLLVSGSATLAPLAVRAVDEWSKRHPRVQARVEAIGSDAGLERLIRFSDTDLALLSRPLTDADRAAAERAGLTLVALPVAWDAVCLVVATGNHWAQNLSTAQVTLAFTSARLWSQLDPEWPAVELHRFVLGPNSGTADVFADRFLAGRKSDLYAASQSSEDDTILARGLRQFDGSIGFLGWASLAQAQGVRAVALDGVAPTPASIRDATYALPRQLWLVTTRASLTSPLVQSFVKAFYDNYEAVLGPTHLVPLSQQERDTVRQTLAD